MELFEQPVSAFMSTPVHTIPANADLDMTEQRLLELRLSSLAVVDSDELVGIVSYTDLLRVGRIEIDEGPGQHRLLLPEESVAGIMSRDLISVDVSTALHAAAQTMIRNNVHRVYVLSAGQLVGVVSTSELMKAVRDARIDRSISSVMSSPVLRISAAATVAEARKELERQQVSGLVVVDQNSWPVGIFSQREAIESAHLDAGTSVDEAMSSAILALPLATSLHHAAAQAAATNVRRVIAVESGALRGIVSGLDFADVVASN